jgi:hypothetical protein
MPPETRASRRLRGSLIQFGRFPAELRCRIWQYAAWENEVLRPEPEEYLHVKVLECLSDSGTRDTYILRDQLSKRLVHSSVARVSHEAYKICREVLSNFPLSISLDYQELVDLDQHKALAGSVEDEASTTGITYLRDSKTTFPLARNIVNLAIDVAASPGTKGQWGRFSNEQHFIQTVTRLFGTKLQNMQLYDADDARAIQRETDSAQTPVIRTLKINEQLDLVNSINRCYRITPSSKRTATCRVLPNAIGGLLASFDKTSCYGAKDDAAEYDGEIEELWPDPASLRRLEIERAGGKHSIRPSYIESPPYYSELLRTERASDRVLVFVAPQTDNGDAWSVFDGFSVRLPTKSVQELLVLKAALASSFPAFETVSVLLASIPWRDGPDGLIPGCDDQTSMPTRLDSRDPVVVTHCDDCGGVRVLYNEKDPTLGEGEHALLAIRRALPTYNCFP